MRGEFDLSAFRKGLREADAELLRAYSARFETAALAAGRPLTAAELLAERRKSFPGNSEPAVKVGSK